ncbi:hypothetical protein [Jeongeupia naejangsanensis]|uniref:Uncharacterized protein n=1 Tax=Jeongeupia naejangsanensis TaxID=613195 RepID=A0ABS2BK18_9NEIS|nr:hypothetical protein [Jeongeupia naejangsanensis]MBM3115174.1 hypothetical protein [Jeongeupia naejangsanensis]
MQLVQLPAHADAGITAIDNANAVVGANRASGAPMLLRFTATQYSLSFSCHHRHIPGINTHQFSIDPEYRKILTYNYLRLSTGKSADMRNRYTRVNQSRWSSRYTTHAHWVNPIPNPFAKNKQPGINPVKTAH